jgi:glycosyltransferase involved in cell wall biosynthesis
MTRPLVSIAMPFYNAAATLGAAIRSILMQSFTDWELLLCDDGSTDNSCDVVASFGDPRIVVWGGGGRRQLGARLNECIARAAGDYIARMDADDIAYPQRLEKQLRFLRDHPEVDLAGGWAVLFAGSGVPSGKRADPVAHADIARRPLHAFKLIHPTFMGQAAWFRRYGYRADAIRCEDHDLLFRARHHSRYANVPEIVLGYRQGRMDLRKRLRSRFSWFCHARRYLNASERLRVAAVEALKSVRDTVAVALRVDVAWQRAQAVALTPTELHEWRQVWTAVS